MLGVLDALGYEVEFVPQSDESAPPPMLSPSS